MYNITAFVNLNLNGGPSKNATELSSLAVTTLNGRLGLKITKQLIKSNYYNTATSIKKVVFLESMNILCQRNSIFKLRCTQVNNSPEIYRV